MQIHLVSGCKKREFRGINIAVLSLFFTVFGSLKLQFRFLWFLPLFLISFKSLADDISAISVPSAKPNVLLVLDYSASMRGRLFGVKKIDSLRSTVNQVIAEYASQFNIGIGPMFNQEAGGIKWPVSDLSAPASLVDPDITDNSITGQDIVLDIVNNTPLAGGTASVPALVEAAQYFRGGAVTLGGADDRNVTLFKPDIWDPATQTYGGGNILSAHQSSYDGGDVYQAGTAPGSVGVCQKFSKFGDSAGPDFCRDRRTFNCKRQTTVDGLVHRVCEYNHSDVWSGANYVSPIKNQCDANHIIFVTDGEPVSRGNAGGFEDITGISAADCTDLASFVGNKRGTRGNCGPELLSHMSSNDLIPSLSNSNVITHTVAFGVEGWAQTYLEALAAAGRGTFYNSRSQEELLEAFESLFSEIASPIDNISQFSIGVDRINASHDDRMYIPLIAPSADKVWSGNLKGYFLDNDGIKDINGNPATSVVDDSLSFTDGARSFWSDSSDGKSVSSGGASGQLDAESRRLYTFIGNPDAISPAGVSLSGGSGTRLEPSNTNLTQDLFSTSVDYRDLLDLSRALPMGDPLHSDVVIADYADGKRVVYTATNQGFIHAIDATEPATGEFNNSNGGNEIFAFMPQELLPNIQYLVYGGFTGEHLYGLDGNIVPIHTDDNNDGIVNGRDKLMLIIGMRRGGSNYYALDVTNPASPRFMWQISGGTGQFEKLAQSWSRPSLISVKSGGSEKKVLVFGGGYDDTIDDRHESTPSNGNAIYFVDTDGDFIRELTHSNMDYAIPSDLRVLDTDGDGLADRIYVGDLGGQVWRLDFNDVSRASDFKLEPLIDVSGIGYQPFFYPPSVSLQVDSQRETYFAVSIGSGNRDNPLADQNRGALYLIEDSTPQNDAVRTLTVSDLYNATSADLQSSNETVAATAQEQLDRRSGWFIQLNPGEKILSETITLDNSIFATSFTPLVDGTAASVCDVPSLAQNRLLGVNLTDAGPANNLSGDDTREPGTSTTTNRFTDLVAQGIASQPQLVFSKDSASAQLFVGKEDVTSIAPVIRKSSWYEK